jgi:hypothetical protein
VAGRRTNGELHLPAAGQRGDGRLLHLRREAHAGQHILHLVVRRVAGVCAERMQGVRVESSQSTLQTSHNLNNS